MDCRTARQKLEVVRPDGTGLQELEARIAPGSGAILNGSDTDTVAAHLESCCACQSVFASQQSRDRVLSQAFMDVPLPSGLRGRLRAALQLGETVVGVEAPPACAERTRLPISAVELGAVGRRKLISRRSWLQISTSVAACLLCGFGIWFGVSSGKSSQITTAEILDRVAASTYDLAQAPDFRKTFAVRLPSGSQMLSPASLVSAQPKSLEVAAGREIGAVYEFQIPSRRGAAHAVLIVLPIRNLNEQSLAALGKSFSAVPLQYPHSHAAKVWTDGGLVYVCLVRSGQPEALESLRPRIYAS